MPDFTVYIERSISTTVEIEAATYEEALAQVSEHDPGDDLQDVDTAGEWEPAYVYQGTSQRLVWEKPSPFVIPVQERDKINATLAALNEGVRRAGEQIASALARAGEGS